MNIDKDTVNRVAFLSRLKIQESEIDEVQKEFNGIVDWMSELDEVNTDGVAPLSAVNSGNLICRPDIVTEDKQADAVLANAPASEYGYFVVPKVIEK